MLTQTSYGFFMKHILWIIGIKHVKYGVIIHVFKRFKTPRDFKINILFIVNNFMFPQRYREGADPEGVHPLRVQVLPGRAHQQQRQTG
jgi:hypothetical protein